MDIWKHGTYIDLWSLVHFLSGFALAGIFYVVGFDFAVAIIVSVSLLLLWEVFEWATKIIEPSINVIFDIIVGFGGFLVGSYLFYALAMSPVYLYIAGISCVLLALWGFLDFLKKGYR